MEKLHVDYCAFGCVWNGWLVVASSCRSLVDLSALLVLTDHLLHCFVFDSRSFCNLFRGEVVENVQLDHCASQFVAVGGVVAVRSAHCA